MPSFTGYKLVENSVTPSFRGLETRIHRRPDEKADHLLAGDHPRFLVRRLVQEETQRSSSRPASNPGTAPGREGRAAQDPGAVSYTHLRAHETDSYLVCRLL